MALVRFYPYDQATIPSTPEKGFNMTILELKKLIEILPDDAEVVIPGSDHSYREPDGIIVDAVWYKRDRQWCEDFDFGTDPKSSRHQVLLIS